MCGLARYPGCKAVGREVRRREENWKEASADGDLCSKRQKQIKANPNHLLKTSKHSREPRDLAFEIPRLADPGGMGACTGVWVRGWVGKLQRSRLVWICPYKVIG